MRFRDYLIEYKVIKPVAIKPDKKSWKQLDSYETKKLKEYIKKKKLDVQKILGKHSARNFDNDRTVDINFQTTNMEQHSITINLKTGEIDEI